MGKYRTRNLTKDSNPPNKRSFYLLSSCPNISPPPKAGNQEGNLQKISASVLIGTQRRGPKISCNRFALLSSPWVSMPPGRYGHGRPPSTGSRGGGGAAPGGSGAPDPNTCISQVRGRKPGGRGKSQTLNSPRFISWPAKYMFYT